MRVGIRSTWLVGRVDPAFLRRDARTLHDHRHADRLVVGVAPLLLHAAVRAEHVAVVGGEHHDGVVGHARRVERFEDPPDRLIDQLVQGVVEAPVRHVGLLLVDHLPPDAWSIAPDRPGGLRTSRTATALRESSGTVSSGGGNFQSLIRTARRTTAMSCGIHERRDREPRPVAARLRELAEELDHLLREHAVAHRAAVGLASRRAAHGRSTRRTRTGRAGRPCGRPRPPRRSAFPSSSEAIRPSWLPGMSRSARETCHLPR